MKKIILSLLFAACLSGISAQTVTDSVSLGAPSTGYYLKTFLHDSISLGAPVNGISYPNDVFYSMRNGVVSVVPGTNWHIAFSARPVTSQATAMRGATIIANEGRGVKVYESTQLFSNWSLFDTAGYSTWNNPHNSDSTWDFGAFNKTSANPFDFGWGVYDPGSHNLIGSKIYLVRVTVGANIFFKKLTVNLLAGDSQWVFTTANINNSDSTRYIINKSAFAGKLFAYNDILTGALINREPNAPWDLLFTRYGANATQFGQTIFSTNTGVLSNPAIMVSKVTAVPFALSVAGAFTDKITGVGADWKINPGPGQPNFAIIDSLSYFIRGADNITDKFAFEGFGGSATGTITFKKEFNKFIGGITYPNDVFYSMKNGVVATIPGQDWQLAFAMRPAAPPFNVMRSTTILANEGRGVTVFESTQSPANFAAFDTTGYKTWVNPHNSDSTWDVGALNANRNLTDGFDFGWGLYDQTTHDLVGTKVFLVRVTIGSGPSSMTTFKKLKIEKLAYDTQWVFTYANLDNSALKTVTLNKSAFAGKLFAYQNLLMDSTLNREPQGKWDLLFTRYGANATQFGQTVFSTNTGALSYPTLLTSRVPGMLVDSAVAGTYANHLTGIGADWKINPGPGQPNFVIRDSVSYFTKAENNREDKLVFKSFTGSNTGVIVFNKTNIHLGVGLVDAKSFIGLVSMYPNPASSTLNFDLNDAKTYAVAIFDITGKIQTSASINATQHSMDISNLGSGIYLVSIENNGAKKVVRLIVQ
ncbi:MAG: T9SS type A sorting domain-containing protein [Bacteroidota bacterium]